MMIRSIRRKRRQFTETSFLCVDAKGARMPLLHSIPHNPRQSPSLSGAGGACRGLFFHGSSEYISLSPQPPIDIGEIYKRHTHRVVCPALLQTLGENSWWVGGHVNTSVLPPPHLKQESGITSAVRFACSTTAHSDKTPPTPGAHLR